MHIETLKMFCDLADLQSFSKTASKNLLSQSAVSQQLSQLEVTLKCQLVDRKKRPIQMTRAGRLLYQAAKDMLDRYNQLQTELNTLNSATSARVDVAAIFSIGMHTLPDYVKKFMVSHSGVNVHVEYLGVRKIYELVLSGEVDIGLVAVPRRDRRLEVYDFAEEPLVLACSPRHEFASETQIDVHRLQFERFIGFDRTVPTRGWIDSILERYGVVVRTVMEFDNIETIKRAVEINAGISILPETSMGQEVSSGIIRSIPFSNEHFTRPTGIILRKDKMLSPACRYFVEMLKEAGR